MNNRQNAQIANQRELFHGRDAIVRQRGELIEQIEARLKQNVTTENIFTIGWRLS